MATTNISIKALIHAEIKGGDKKGIPYSPIILDPLTKSYSTAGKLIYYEFAIRNVSGLTDATILTNGKNSRFTAEGTGTCNVELYIEDDAGNSDTDTITITII